MKYTQQLLRLVVENQKMDIEEILEYLSDLGIVEDEMIKRALIKHEYMKRQGKDESGIDIKNDLAVKYECSLPHVNNMIYYHPEIKV